MVRRESRPETGPAGWLGSSRGAGLRPAASEYLCMVRRWVRVAAAAALGTVMAPSLVARAVAAPARPAQASPACPVLVLSALPVEIAPILAAAHVDPKPAWVYHGRGFWSGTVAGTPAIVAITGIGLQNATITSNAAFSHFHCLSAVVFSGTSGGDYIGDVMVPARWTEDGKHFLATTPALLAVLRRALSQPVRLEQTTPIGNPLCPCGFPGVQTPVAPVAVLHKPRVEVGGTGLSNDGFGGRVVPCVPSGSDVLGCWPCRFADTGAGAQAGNLGGTVPPFLQAAFILDYGKNSGPPPGSFVSSDNETAAVFAVAARHRVPFIGFRAASDGGGDPLHLPGFPVQFFVYKQLAADNAASTALAFLRAWHAARH